MAKNTVEKAIITLGSSFDNLISHPSDSSLILSLWVEGKNVSEISGEDLKELRQDIADKYSELVNKTCFKFLQRFGVVPSKAHRFIQQQLLRYRQNKDQFKDSDGILAQLSIQLVVDPETTNIDKLVVYFYAGDGKDTVPKIELDLRNPEDDENKLEAETEGKRMLEACDKCFTTVFDPLDSMEIELFKNEGGLSSEEKVIKNDNVAKFFYHLKGSRCYSQDGSYGSPNANWSIFKIDFKNELSDVNESNSRRNFIKAIIGGTFESVREAISSNKELKPLAEKLYLDEQKGTNMSKFWGEYIDGVKRKSFDRKEINVGIILDRAEGIKILAGANFSEPEKFKSITDYEFDELYNIFKKSFSDCVKEKTKDHKLLYV